MGHQINTSTYDNSSNSNISDQRFAGMILAQCTSAELQFNIKHRAGGQASVLFMHKLPNFYQTGKQQQCLNAQLCALNRFPLTQ